MHIRRTSRARGALLASSCPLDLISRSCVAYPSLWLARAGEMMGKDQVDHTTPTVIGSMFSKPLILGWTQCGHGALIGPLIQQQAGIEKHTLEAPGLLSIESFLCANDNCRRLLANLLLSLFYSLFPVCHQMPLASIQIWYIL